MERLSRYVWPWREAWLAGLLGLAACLDYLSTYAVLELSGKQGVYEHGFLASRALELGGFRGLLLLDITAVAGLCLLASTVRYVYARFGFRGFARTAYVAALVPYTLAAFSASVNNLVLTLS